MWRSAKYAAWRDIRMSEREDRIRRQAKRAAAQAAIFDKAERARIVSQIIDVLHARRLSIFQFEAACRHGIRKKLVLDGFAWQLSDDEAATIVSMAFTKLGAKRPTYEQGQHEHARGNDYCAWCHGPIPDELLFADRPFSYCSERCVIAARRSRELFDHRMETRAYAATQRVMAQLSRPTRHCAGCGRPFRPTHDEQVFCGQGCYHASKVIHPEKNCEHCGASFKPSMSGGRFCSLSCFYAHQQTDQRIRVCACPSCLNEFVPKKPNALYCSKACGLRAFRIARNGVDVLDLIPADP